MRIQYLQSDTEVTDQSVAVYRLIAITYCMLLYMINIQKCICLHYTFIILDVTKSYTLGL